MSEILLNVAGLVIVDVPELDTPDGWSTDIGAGMLSYVERELISVETVLPDADVDDVAGGEEIFLVYLGERGA